MLHSLLKGAVVLVVSDALASEQSIMRALATQGCTSERGEPGVLLDPSLRYDACVIDMHCHRGWGSGMILGLRTAALPCATLMLFAQGEAGDVTAALGSGAVDCLVMPFDSEELLDAVTNAIECTKRWRSRVSSLRLRTLHELVPLSAAPITIIPIPDFSDPIQPAPEVVQSRAREGSGPRIEIIVRRLAVPVILFIWGPGRILPVRVTSFSVEETLYSPTLDPLHANVSLGLDVMTPDSFRARGELIQGIAVAAYSYTRLVDDALAIANAIQNVNRGVGLPPFI